MDFFMTSSRGRDMELPNLYPMGGGKILHLTDIGLQLLEWAKEDDPLGQHTIYLVAGIPDTTEMIRDGGLPRSHLQRGPGGGSHADHEFVQQSS